MIKRLIPILISVLVLAPLFFTNSCANTTQSPTGGDKDTIPPVITGISPLPGATRVPVEGFKVVFEFNEYVVIKNKQNIFLSPPMDKPLISKIVEKKLVITFDGTLKENTTYTINLGDALADNNEGNMYPGYTYVFSTGDTIDSLYFTGSVLDCNTLNPVKGATVLLYKDLSDSAVFLQRPFAAAKTDEWGFFSMQYLKDTVYRLYAIKDAGDNNIYDPDTDLIAFYDSIMHPYKKVNDTIYELFKFDMKDTMECLARKTDYELRLFREKPSKQYLVNKVRTSDRSAYITFNAPYAWIDTMWIAGYKPENIITEFNILQDSLLIWVNSLKTVPDTLHLYVNYRKTDSLGMLKPELEHHRLYIEGAAGKRRSKSRKNIKPEDTTCVFKMIAPPEKIEQDGFRIEFNNPIISAKFDSVTFKYINPKQKEFSAKYTVERDTLNLKSYILKPNVKLQPGFDYVLRLPKRTFRDITGFYSDSLITKVALPKDEELSTLKLEFSGVDRKIIVDLLPENGKEVIRTYIIDSDKTLTFPYLKEAKYCIRITEDGNNNSIVDTGSLLEHRQPERVFFYKLGKDKYINIPKASEVEQKVELANILNDKQ